MKNPRPVAELDARGLKGLFFDIDETFSTDGKITAQAYSAAWELHNAGMVLVPITGRPAGWCDHIARMWPVNAVVGENGAFYCMLKRGRMEKRYTADLRSREQSLEKLEAVKKEVLEEVPGAGIASDQQWREFDLAIDFCEDVKRLPADEVDRIVKIFERHGASAKVSSIHVNGWFGDYDKLTAMDLFVKQELGMDLSEANSSFAFIGDSPNDEPLFCFFENSVGVANVMEFAVSLKHGPSFITRGCSGAGFSELAAQIVSG